MKRVIVFDERDVAKFMIHIVRMEVLIQMNIKALEYARNNKELGKIITDTFEASRMHGRFLKLLRQANEQGVKTPSKEIIEEVRREMGEDV